MLANSRKMSSVKVPRLLLGQDDTPIALLPPLVRSRGSPRIDEQAAWVRMGDLQYFVHWKGLPVAYGEWLSDSVLRQLPSAVAHIYDYLRLFKIQDPLALGLLCNQTLRWEAGG